MTDTFSILEVTSGMRTDVEQLGSKPKFWFKWQGERWLYKRARPETGEDWSEKVASEIAVLLGLPTHRVELAVWEGNNGCAVKSFLTPEGNVLVHGNELLGGVTATMRTGEWCWNAALKRGRLPDSTCIWHQRMITAPAWAGNLRTRRARASPA